MNQRSLHHRRGSSLSGIRPLACECPTLRPGEIGNHPPCTSVDLMETVGDLLARGEVVAAQEFVIAIESERSTLPSSVFERVLRAALAAKELTPAYADFCRRAYGATAYATMVQS